MIDEPTQLKAAALEPNKSAVELLREWLKNAEEGEVQGVLLVGMVAGGMVRRGYAGNFSYPELISACEVAKHDLLHQAMEGDQDVERGDDE